MRLRAITRAGLDRVPRAGVTRDAGFPGKSHTRAKRSRDVPIEKASGMPLRQKERHRTERIGWLRAAVLGANDGIISTASLVLGIAAAHGSRSNVLVAGVAGLVAGAMAMAAGEYVSVHSQADTEQAELKRERAELDDKGKHKGLMAIYLDRGLGIPRLFGRVRFQAALASAGSFAVGAA